ncbi:DUF4232 domain-containing protein [Sphingomonas immobilis]|jgi:hypothetical protein|uniref:DUF4232 domain-containing protein n=1 Tax=Sphingomonas immobilis TaxID=3063997 RepID=UPI003D67EDAE
MSHSGVELSIRNIGSDCSLPGLQMIEFRDARGRVLPASRRAPVGMHPGPVLLPVRIAGGHRAVADIRWVSGPVFDHSRRTQAATISLRIGKTLVRAPLKAVLYGERGSLFSSNGRHCMPLRGWPPDSVGELRAAFRFETLFRFETRLRE